MVKVSLIKSKSDIFNFDTSETLKPQLRQRLIIALFLISLTFFILNKKSKKVLKCSIFKVRVLC